MLRRFGEVPSLGSEKDFVLRQYVQRELYKESLQLRLELTASLGVSDANKSSFLSDYRKLSSLIAFQDLALVEEEADMRNQLDEILATRPKLTVHKDGQVVVTDLFKKVVGEEKTTPTTQPSQKPRPRRR